MWDTTALSPLCRAVGNVQYVNILTTVSAWAAGAYGLVYSGSSFLTAATQLNVADAAVASSTFAITSIFAVASIGHTESGNFQKEAFYSLKPLIDIARIDNNENIRKFATFISTSTEYLKFHNWLLARTRMGGGTSPISVEADMTAYLVASGAGAGAGAAAAVPVSAAATAAAAAAAAAAVTAAAADIELHEKEEGCAAAAATEAAAETRPASKTAPAGRKKPRRDGPGVGGGVGGKARKTRKLKGGRRNKYCEPNKCYTYCAQSVGKRRTRKRNKCAPKKSKKGGPKGKRKTKKAEKVYYYNRV